MKKKIITALVICVSLSTTGCAAFSNWWSDLKNNPAEVVQSFDNVVTTVMADVAVAWSAVQLFIPTSALPTATTVYQNAVVSVNHAVLALNSALQAASDAHQSNPDLSALMSAVSTAVNQVIAIVDQYGGKVSPTHLGAINPVPGLVDAHAGAQSLSRWVH